MRLLCLLLLLPAALLAQPTAKGWQELTISDGLSQGMIFSIKQDRKGFIWAASRDGLNRYDGHNFTVFTHDPYNEFSISGNYCTALLIDSHNRLWVGTSNQGLNLFDERTRHFHHIDIRDQAAPNAGSYEVKVLAEDPEGNIWVNTDQGKLFKISLPNSLKNNFPDQPAFTNQVRSQQVALPSLSVNGTAHSISFKSNGQALVGTSFGLYSLNWHQPKKAARTPVFAVETTEFLSMYEDPKQDYWAASTSDKIICWQHGVRKSIPLPKKGNFSVRLKAVDKNTLSIVTPDFLWIMSPAELFQRDSLTARSAFLTIPPNLYAITDLLKDRTDNLWIGTSGYGLRKFNPRVRQFHTYLPNTSVTYLYQDRRGQLYARYQYAYGRFDKAKDRLVPFISTRLSAADQRQRYFIQDRQGFFWVSNVNFDTHFQQLYKFSPDWQLLKKYPLPVNTSFGFSVNQTLEDKTGNLWIGAINGKLLRFDPQSETFQVFSYQSLVPQSGAEIETSALCIDPDGTLWIGTSQGLVRAVHPQTIPAFSLYKNSTTDRRSLSNNFVSSLLNDPNQPARYLWVGTKGGGLERLNKQARSEGSIPVSEAPGRFDHFTEAQGLPNKVVYGILADEFRNLWLSTNRGLAQFNPRTFTCRNYTKADGLQDDEFNTGSFFKTAAGELLFGGVNGLTTFRASEVGRVSDRQPLANIIGLKVNNEPIEVGAADGILPATIEHTRQLDLAHTQNLLTFEFGVMDFTNSVKNRYRYRMEGVDNDWVEAGTNRFANYTHLPDGHYQFEMMGSADGEVWSKPVTLQIRVHPPFYRTWWAYLLYALILAAAGWQLYRFQTQRLLLQQQIDFEQQEASRLAELDALKTRFFTNISHEFRTPLTLILGPLTDLRQRFEREKVVTLTKPVVALMEQNSRRLLSLINQLLDLSKLEAGQLQPEPERGDMAAFFRTLASSFDSLAESRQVVFRFEQTEPERWADFDPDKLEKIVTNLLANAFKFTPAGNAVRVAVRYTGSPPHELTLTVEDTGIGIAPDQLTHIFERFYQRSADAGSVHPVNGHVSRPHEGTGIGLALVNELVKVLGGTIDVTSTEGIGTTFVITMPLVTAEETSGSAAPNSLKEAKPTGSKAPFRELGAADPEVQLPASENILLIIDDNADIRAYVRSIFETDYQIIEAGDGLDGLERATVSLPDIIICDLMMPRLDGFGFCRTLKNQEATSHIPVVMLTARATAEDRIKGFELGADDYLTKPFNRTELKARVRNLVRQQERLYRRFATNPPTDTAQLPPLTQPVGPAEPVMLAAQQQFLDRLTRVVLAHIDETEFSVEHLAEAVNMSRTQLHRKLKTLTNTTTTNFIRDIRLAKAAQLLGEGGEAVTQVAYAVGFENLSYFAKVFQERYGILPSQYGSTQPSPAQIAAILPIK